MDPIVPPASMRQDADVFQSEAFIQNLGEALSRFPEPARLIVYTRTKIGRKYRWEEGRKLISVRLVRLLLSVVPGFRAKL
jgi:hypothetical protein